MAIHDFVTARLYYYNALYLGLPLQMIWKQHLVQNSEAHLLTATEHK